MIKKTLSVDLEAFAKEVLKPHFHSGGPPKKVGFANAATPFDDTPPPLHIGCHVSFLFGY